MVDIFSQTAEKIGLQINTGKIKVLYQPSPDSTDPQEPDIVIDSGILEVVPNFKYLGSTLSIDNRADN